MPQSSESWQFSENGLFAPAFPLGNRGVLKGRPFRKKGDGAEEKGGKGTRKWSDKGVPSRPF